MKSVEKSRENFLWAKVLSYFFLAFWLSYLAVKLIMSFKSIYSIQLGYIQNIGLAIIVLIISYFLIAKSEAYKIFGIHRKKYGKSALSSDKMAEYGNHILLYLKSERPFLDNEFNLSKFSQLIGIPSNNISQILNEELGISFTDLINKMRVEEMKKRLVDPKYKNLTILGIAYDVGFNSKTAMIRNFKKFTQTTPSEFKNNS